MSLTPSWNGMGGGAWPLPGDGGGMWALSPPGGPNHFWRGRRAVGLASSWSCREVMDLSPSWNRRGGMDSHVDQWIGYSFP